ncbi:nuclear transport factor 2 family protein [Mycolicibacterium aichiense]|nr:nuclear transport factor 2 family protein [Mycolicibacterium aichiense]MCV7020409.1 nuclear transport factor 2 family protein [Mycolicibacterium aichiense]
MTSKPPVPPFTDESAAQKVRLAENAWNTCDPQVVSQAYSVDSIWRNRSVFVTGRAQIVEFLSGKWDREHEYRLIKELWAHSNDRIAARFAYEYRDDSGQWFRAYGNENWLFDEHGLMTHRHASINDVPIDEGERKFFWDQNAPRPADHPSLSDLGL